MRTTLASLLLLVVGCGDGSSTTAGAKTDGGADSATTASGGSSTTSGGASSTGGRPGSGGSTSSSGGSPSSSGGAGGSPSTGGVSSSTGGASGSGGSPAAAPLDMYIMFDQSGSMLNTEPSGATRMQAVSTALGDFVREPESSGVGVGIGYFGYQPIGQTSCAPVDYERPDVAVGTLPGNARAIVASLDARQPTGETPTGAAIRGACTYAKSWKAANLGHKVVILLLTDGKPEAPITCGSGSGPCCPTLDDAVAATTDCLGGTPGVPTYVLGVGTLLDNLTQIAVAGGTGQAYLVSGGTDVVSALNAIRDAAARP